MIGLLISIVANPGIAAFPLPARILMPG